MYLVRSAERFHPIGGGLYQEVVLQQKTSSGFWCQFYWWSPGPKIPSLKEANDEIRRNFGRKVCLGSAILVAQRGHDRLFHDVSWTMSCHDNEVMK